jgi:hypothetical protein
MQLSPVFHCDEQTSPRGETRELKVCIFIRSYCIDSEQG